MQLKSIVDKFGALRFMADDLELLSGPGRRVLMETSWIKEPTVIEKEFNLLAEYRKALLSDNTSFSRQLLEIKLEKVRDIRGTVKRLQEGAILDDVEWFEIKSFALLIEEIRPVLPACGITVSPLPDLSLLVQMLDPEGLKIASFYVYNAYSGYLADLRKCLKAIPNTEQTEQERQRLFEQIAGEEMQVRTELSRKASLFAADAASALYEIARIDLLYAKAKQMIKRGLCIPSIAGTEAETTYKGLFHPEVAQRLEKESKSFQPVDFSFSPEPVLITGSNMGGKSVLLNMTALAQFLFQFGFAIPAREASIAPVDRVALCLTQENGIKRGLSSFATEISNIQEIIRLLREGHSLLAVIDEPAQTTNPIEGTAIVSGLIALLRKLKARAVITTHYSGIGGNGRRMRVKGFTTTDDSALITSQNIGNYMDYSLTEETGGALVPREALRVAKLLGADREWLENSRKMLNFEADKE